MRSTTRLSHSQGLVELEERAEPFDIPYERDMAKYVMMPGNAIKRHLVVEARLKQMAEDACGFPVNKVEYNDLSVGFITSGIAYQYVKEAMPEASVLKLGIVNPLPRKLIDHLAVGRGIHKGQNGTLGIFRVRECGCQHFTFCIANA